MAIATVKQLCTPNAVVTSDSLVEQVAQIEEFASAKLTAKSFSGATTSRLAWSFWSNAGSTALPERADDGAFYLTQAMGGGKTHSLIAFGLLAANPELRKEVLPKSFSWKRLWCRQSRYFQRPPEPRQSALGLHCGEA